MQLYDIPTYLISLLGLPARYILRYKLLTSVSNHFIIVCMFKLVFFSLLENFANLRNVTDCKFIEELGVLVPMY